MSPVSLLLSSFINHHGIKLTLNKTNYWPFHAFSGAAEHYWRKLHNQTDWFSLNDHKQHTGTLNPTQESQSFSNKSAFSNSVITVLHFYFCSQTSALKR